MLQSGPADDDDPPRARWQWVVFGALAIVTTWVPAAAVAGAFVARFAPRPGDAPPDAVIRVELTIAGAYGLALFVGAAAGGYVVGRWAAAAAGVREAALSGLVASIAAAGASWVSLGPSPAPAVLPLLIVPAAALGGMLGLRRRARAG
jgi:hypothetical protein